MGITIHVIRRNGVCEFRCGSTTADSYILDSQVEEPFNKLQDAVSHIVGWQVRNRYGVFENLSHPEASRWHEPDTRESATKSWTKYLEEVLRGGKEIIDIDAYVQIVQKITAPDVASGVYLLGNKEIEILRKVGEYLINERKIPVSGRNLEDNFRLDLFNVTIDKLTDFEGYPKERPHPKLKMSDVSALNGAHTYIGWLETTYFQRE